MRNKLAGELSAAMISDPTLRTPDLWPLRGGFAMDDMTPADVILLYPVLLPESTMKLEPSNATLS